MNEERWIPVCEDGTEWAPRSREQAEQAMSEYPAGGMWPGTDEPCPGITHIRHEVRTCTPWVEVD